MRGSRPIGCHAGRDRAHKRGEVEYGLVGHLLDMIKIDQSFIAEIGMEPYGRTIVAAVTNLATLMASSVTAEGVETTRQHDEVVAIRL